MVDVKQDYNITSPDIIKTCSTIHDTNMIISKLGSIGNDILALEKGTIKQIKKVKAMKKETTKVLIEVIKPFAGIDKGVKKLTNTAIAKNLIARGLVKMCEDEEDEIIFESDPPVLQPKAKKTRKTSTKK